MKRSSPVMLGFRLHLNWTVVQGITCRLDHAINCILPAKQTEAFLKAILSANIPTLSPISPNCSNSTIPPPPFLPQLPPFFLVTPVFAHFPLSSTILLGSEFATGVGRI